MKIETGMSADIHRLTLRRASRQHLQSGLLVVVTLVTMIGCGNQTDSDAKPAQAPPSVKIAQPLAQDVTEWDEYTGRIEAVSSVDVRARVSGYLEKVNFKAGEMVKKGDLLFLIDPKPFSAQLNYAEAELERAKAKRELAKNDLVRAESLFRGKAISEEEYDARSKGLREAVATVNSAEANVYTARLKPGFHQDTRTDRRANRPRTDHRGQSGEWRRRRCNAVDLHRLNQPGLCLRGRR